jgi:hypothetical protein
MPSYQSWERAFFGLRACAFALPAETLSRSFLGLKFCAFAFALSGS